MLGDHISQAQILGGGTQNGDDDNGSGNHHEDLGAKVRSPKMEGGPKMVRMMTKATVMMMIWVLE